MSRARHKEHEKHKEHKERAEGGRLSSEPKWNAGEEQNAAKEAEERKRGGKVHHHEAEGEEGKKRMDRKERRGRAKGGRIGANLMPLSTAARVKHVTKGERPEEGEEDMATSKKTITG
jgi:hypothetical protein